MPEQPALEPRQIYPYADEIVRYEPKNHIGSGGSGAEVCYGFWYRQDATGTMVGNEAALKYRYFSEEDMLQAANGGANKTLARFICEVSCVRDAGRHPNIMEIWDYEVDPEGGQIIMAMPNYGGGRLNKRMSAPMPVDEALGYAAQIGGALQHLHDHGIVHRDVKPSNLLFANDGRLVLTDFDVAVRINPRNAQEEQDKQTPYGTSDYIAPEQTLTTGNVGPASDQYALAAVMYQIVTGKKLFSGTQAEVVTAQVYTLPNSFETHMQGCVPAQAQAIEPCIQKALAKDPAQRFASVTEFVQAMQDAAEQQTLRSKYADPILQMGLHAAMGGETATAHEYFTYAIKTDPTNITARYMHAMALDRLGEYDDARAAYSALDKLVPRSPDEVVMKGYAAAAAGNEARAIQYLHKAIKLNCSDQDQVEAYVACLQDQLRKKVGETTLRIVGRNIWRAVRNVLPKRFPPTQSVRV